MSVTTTQGPERKKKMPRITNTIKRLLISPPSILKPTIKRLIANAAAVAKYSRQYIVVDISVSHPKLYKQVEIDQKIYISNQIEKTSRRLADDSLSSVTWTSEDSIAQAAKLILRHFPERKIQGLCQGVRNGFEISWFKKHLSGRAECIIGTDVDPNAARDDVIIHDFNQANPDWFGRFDFVYSNSHDHALNLQKTLNIWVQYLNLGGILILEHGKGHGEQYTNGIDICGVETELFPFVACKLFHNSWSVREIHNIHDSRHVLFIIEKNNDSDDLTN